MGATGGLPPLLRPDLPAGMRVQAACSGREGGVSAPPYDSLNLGDHVGDDPAHVAENRRRYEATLGARPVFLRQVHGRRVVQLTRATPDGQEADACWTTEPGLACTVMVADCLPVLLTHRGARAVGAAHCGWRGLAGEGGPGVLEALWTQLWPQFAPVEAQAAEEAIAWLGPCIGPQAFEVGAEVREAYVRHDPGSAAHFLPHGPDKFLADLPALARRRLGLLGIREIHGNDGSPAWCTVGNPSRFFSHRRDRVTGRFAASIWLA